MYTYLIRIVDHRPSARHDVTGEARLTLGPLATWEEAQARPLHVLERLINSELSSPELDKAAFIAACRASSPNVSLHASRRGETMIVSIIEKDFRQISVFIRLKY